MFFQRPHLGAIVYLAYPDAHAIGCTKLRALSYFIYNRNDKKIVQQRWDTKSGETGTEI